MREILLKYLPKNVVPTVENVIKNKKIHFTITKNRKTKAGDYRSPHNGFGHRITVNSTLNKYAFTITFFHEYAHLLTWETYKRNVSPHGREWKAIFGNLLKQLIDMDLFPNNLKLLLKNYATNPLASTQSDIYLSKELKTFDIARKFHTTILNIPAGEKFKLDDGRIFIMGEMKRTRVWCKEYNTGKTFAFNPNTEVMPIQKYSTM